MANAYERAPEHQQRQRRIGRRVVEVEGSPPAELRARPELEADSEQDQYGSGNQVCHRRTVARCAADRQSVACGSVVHAPRQTAIEPPRHMRSGNR
jgi:hypothetical protein